MKHGIDISFIVITNGERTQALSNLVDSVNQNAPWRIQIVLVGKVGQFTGSDATIVEAADEAGGGRISFLKNKGAEVSSGSILCFFDDDIALTPEWFEDIQPLFDRLFNGSLDFAGCRVVGPNGRRWYDWSWASRNDPNCPSLLYPYCKKNRNVYLSGCCLMARADSFAKVRFNESQGYYQREDIDFSHRAWDLGMRLSCYNRAQITHLLLPSGRTARTHPADRLFQESIYQYRLGRLEAAKDRLERARLEGLQIDRYQYTSGLFALFGHDCERARRNFEALLNRKTAGVFHRAQSHYRLGVLLLGSGSVYHADQHFRSVLQLVPEHPMAGFRLNRLRRRRLAEP